MLKLNQFKKIHFVGIGGIGMSGLARIFKELGYEVTGSDKIENYCTHKLQEMGVKVYLGHRESNIDRDTEIVVYSSSISWDNPELLEAREKKIPILHRADVLAFLMQSRIGIAVAGAHGKTTITAMTAHLLSQADFTPTVVIGGVVNQYNTNAWLGKGNFMVAEADESDGSFIKLSPFYTIITNIDFEHLDYYKNIEKIVSAYQRFVEKTRETGCVFFCYDDPYLKKIIPGLPLRSVSYGLNPLSDVYPQDIVL
ncbi:MAG: UDP-N-acetylmuramate--L-alanine ligase, partial [Candidatus Omnitrophota bacterium]